MTAHHSLERLPSHVLAAILHDACRHEVANAAGVCRALYQRIEGHAVIPGADEKTRKQPLGAFWAHWRSPLEASGRPSPVSLSCKRCWKMVPYITSTQRTNPTPRYDIFVWAINYNAMRMQSGPSFMR